ncbi:MAG: hypothetical protein R3E97_02520 [Candidatus Eisenbacteria bacterium]
MRKLTWLLAVTAMFVSGGAYASNVMSTGGGVGVLNDTYDGSCGDLLFNADGTYENGYAWAYGGTYAPYYGAFAEKYDTNRKVCSVVMDLTQTGNQAGRTCDLYVWEDASGVPGPVLGVAFGHDPGTVAFWPSISRHVGSVTANCSSTDATWVGYWGSWVDQIAAWFVTADLDGFGGSPFTCIAPGIGYPTGWNNVSIVWGPTQALGLGAEFVDCDVVPVENKTWGAIKSLYK